MSINDKPFDITNSENEPWLLNVNKDQSILDSNGEQLTAEYIWSKQGADRDKLVQYVFDYYRKHGFPQLKLSEEELRVKFDKFLNKDVSDVYNKESNVIKNSNSTCTDILKHFCGKKFYQSRGDYKKSNSCYDVFYKDETFLKVLKNRMGYSSSKEDGKLRPYVFNIADKMVIQGMKSSGLAYNVSTFKPTVAKFINEHFINLVRVKDKERTDFKYFDYSSGWGARWLGSSSINNITNNIKLSYTGLDPFTYNEINNMIKFYDFNKFDNVINGCSENEDVYNNIEHNSYDFSWSSPPYFTLETYGLEEKNQSIILHSEYEKWLLNYWDKTVKNVKNFVLKKNNNSYFGLVVVEGVGKYNLSEDMNKIIVDNGFGLIDTISFGTSKSHLSGKIKTRKLTKNSEKLFIYSNKV